MVVVLCHQDGVRWAVLYLDTSPYNFWYRLLHVDDLLRVQTGEHSYRSVNILAYFHTLALMTGMVIIIGEMLRCRNRQ